MQVSAREVGRRLELRVGGQDDPDAVVVLVPPVNGAVGTALWGYYGGVLFVLQPEAVQVQQDVVTMTRLAVGGYWDDDTPQPERERAEAQWALMESLRWEEAEAVAQAALMWNMQGGGMDAVEALLDPQQGGYQGAQELVLRRNNLWRLYSEIRTSSSSESGSATPAPDGSSGTSTPSGTWPPSAPTAPEQPEAATSSPSEQPSSAEPAA